MSYDNTNSGVLFKNDKKETDTHPDYTGSFNKDGTEYFLSAWLNKSAAGKTYMSVKLGNEKEAQPQQQVQQAPPVNNLSEDEIPF
jgi:uncharacterized protein (DUF736 family)